ncbi:MAG: LPS export ABC transporter periplasmic protein LptC [Candidatus Omnitrophica bacterium]|nr:LPS export ABC transporter periplasmic protein LptC [Candidatus Omnitrophota bacterium]MBU1657296.1 LPS export ABC transporter periplasmic protein LptC [Candidatus Omnitrophota bacterium]MBU1783724.1 LPS export ABC transporter periplasmic protein LptC [Candidatus Omnitrophota bacterium]MBU1851177.1 LPS export ABC transporter periplasmic protein LptC [Candidatus Omnitrophota bacterium]
MKKIILFLLLASAIGVFYANRHSRSDVARIAGKTTAGPFDSAGLKQKVLVFSIDGRTSKGVKQWHLEGKAAELVDNKIYLEDLNGAAFGEEFTINLLSDKGVYCRDRSEVELIGNVKVTADDGTVLITDQAVWSQSTKDIFTDAPVRIEREDMVATGTGGRANSEKRIAMLFSDVTVEMKPATLVKCDGSLEAGFNENKAVFLENVRVTDKDGELIADKLTVHIDPETRKISEVIAEGNVKLLKGNSYTLCEKTTYTDGTGSVKFFGRPRVVIAPEELEGSGFPGTFDAAAGSGRDEEKK